MEIYERLQKLRTEKNISQEELADMLNISRQAVSKWESGKSKPDIDNIVKLSEIYGVSIDYILVGEEPEKDNYEKSNLSHVVDEKTKTKTRKNNRGCMVLVLALLIFLFAIVVSIMLFIIPGEFENYSESTMTTEEIR